MKPADNISLIKAIIGYLSNVKTGIKIKGKRESVEELTQSIEKVKKVLSGLKVTSDLEEAPGGKTDKWKLLMTGIAGFLLGKNTGVKLKGQEKEIKKLAQSIKDLSSTIEKVKRPEKIW